MRAREEVDGSGFCMSDKGDRVWGLGDFGSG